MKKEFICILCPRGCRITVAEDGNISGNFCSRGVRYVETEMNEPKRTLTSTVRTIFAELPRVSVKTSEPIPKELIFEVMKLLDDVLIIEPTPAGSVLIKNVLDTGADMILTRSCMM